ncbi:short chain dehydrogenase/reductase [Pseudovirgaria hyperparasitica]|uniref:Short-chain dehydrogenase/reductase 3 n=1 Tax=Pseudovirgaria hyperparasitica TaxID=470096 RepID=A0A6A6WB98_9PEZI|nr:short chain dehydrogenase/reductase [Pseudovirgaria hyperparasitica]KAF2758381.1 short chain dehydrogenase/reductase [Pseudovirgaria hyperparasitica]
MTTDVPRLERVIATPKFRETAPDKPWQHYMTIDTINTVLQRSLLHPFIAWMVPLSMRAQLTPYHFTSMKVAIAYATLITILWILGVVNKRVAHGLPRDVDLSDEVIVITGGGSGLGQLIAEVYGMRGASVAILDVQDGKEAEAKGIAYYKCDVGSREQIQDTAKQIEQDLGTPTILINNAGVMNGKSLLDLSFEDVERTMRTNLLSHFYTIKTFLPGMLNEGRGTIVTVSSVLGNLGAANLSDYTASKAALNALHASLKAELELSTHESAPWIRTILCCPGQLSTSLFAGVRTPSNFLAPIVEPVEIAKEIIKLVDAGESGDISAPLYARWIGLYGILPVGVRKIARHLSGIDYAMISRSASPPKN